MTHTVGYRVRQQHPDPGKDYVTIRVRGDEIDLGWTTWSRAVLMPRRLAKNLAKSLRAAGRAGVRMVRVVRRVP